VIVVQRWLFHLARLGLASVFIYAGAVKSSDVGGFAGQVAGYQILPYAANYLVAATLPYVEFLAGLLLMFMAALALAVARGLEIDCGCFSPEGGGVSARVTLLRDVGLMALVAVTWWLRGRLTQSADKE